MCREYSPLGSIFRAINCPLMKRTASSCLSAATTCMRGLWLMLREVGLLVVLSEKKRLFVPCMPPKSGGG